MVVSIPTIATIPGLNVVVLELAIGGGGGGAFVELAIPPMLPFSSLNFVASAVVSKG